MPEKKQECDLVIPNNHCDKRNDCYDWFAKKHPDFPSTIAPNSCVSIDVWWVSNWPEWHEKICSQNNSHSQSEDYRRDVHVQLLNLVPTVL